MTGPVSPRHGCEPTLLSGDHMTATPGRSCACVMASFQLRESVQQGSKEHCGFDFFQPCPFPWFRLHLFCVLVFSFVRSLFVCIHLSVYSFV